MNWLENEESSKRAADKKQRIILEQAEREDLASRRNEEHILKALGIWTETCQRVAALGYKLEGIGTSSLLGAVDYQWSNGRDFSGEERRCIHFIFSNDQCIMSLGRQAIQHSSDKAGSYHEFDESRTKLTKRDRTVYSKSESFKEIIGKRNASTQFIDFFNKQSNCLHVVEWLVGKSDSIPKLPGKHIKTSRKITRESIVQAAYAGLFFGGSLLGAGVAIILILIGYSNGSVRNTVSDIFPFIWYVPAGAVVGCIISISAKFYKIERGDWLPEGFMPSRNPRKESNRNSIGDAIFFLTLPIAGVSAIVGTFNEGFSGFFRWGIIGIPMGIAIAVLVGVIINCLKR